MRFSVYEVARSGVHDVARLHTNNPERQYQLTLSATRAHWVWIADRDADQTPDDYTSEAIWVVAYFDEGVPDDPSPDSPEEWETFVVGDWNPWPMTARTRFVLWQALAKLQAELDLGLHGWPQNSERPDDNNFMQDFPPLVRFEPRVWWEAL